MQSACQRRYSLFYLNLHMSPTGSPSVRQKAMYMKPQTGKLCQPLWPKNEEGKICARQSVGQILILFGSFVFLHGPARKVDLVRGKHHGCCGLRGIRKTMDRSLFYSEEPEKGPLWPRE